MSFRIASLVAVALLTSPPAWPTGLNAPLGVLQLAGEEGEVIAKTALAVRYEHGEGIARDLAQAHGLYCFAARAGHAEAQFRLGWMYANARGVSRDDAVAAELFRRAAAQGHVHAERMLRLVGRGAEPRVPGCLAPEPPPEIAAGEDLIVETDANTEPAPAGEMQRLVYQLARAHGVDPGLALAVAAVESGFNPNAVSPKNAQGVMQLIPATAQRFGVKRVFDPEENVRGGLAYLRWLLALFRGDVRLAVAAYNAGERAVERHRGVPPYAETREYVRKVTSLYRKTAHPFDAGLAEPSPMLARVPATRQ